MTRDVRTLQRNDQLDIADDVMRLERIRHMPVLDDEGDTLVGLVSQRDLFRGALARALGYGEHAQEKLLGQLVVKEVMTNDPVNGTSPTVTLAMLLMPPTITAPTTTASPSPNSQPRSANMLSAPPVTTSTWRYAWLDWNMLPIPKQPATMAPA